MLLLAACGPPVPERLNVGYGDARQLVVVTTPTWGSTSGSLTTYERDGRTWRAVHGPFPARIGRNGFRVDRREGDGTTPAGSFLITGVMGRQPDPGARFPYRRIVPGDCWISDVSSPSYNRLVTAIPCTRPNEDLYAIGIGPYRYLATVGYNTNPIVPGLGSAIFLHRHQYTASGASAATSGCISLAEPELLAVLRWLDPAAHPRVVMGPDAWLVHP